MLLVRDRHVGTLLLSSAGLLGAVWLGCLTAGILVSSRAPGEQQRPCLACCSHIIAVTDITVLSDTDVALLLTYAWVIES